MFIPVFKLFKSHFIWASFFLLVSCSSPKKEGALPADKQGLPHKYISQSKDAEAFVPVKPQDDPEYSPTLLKWERDVNLYKDLELFFSGTVVLMTPEMTEAYKNQVKKVQGETAKIDTNIVPEGKDMLSVVIAMYTPSAKFLELDNNKIWSVSLYVNHEWLSPSSLVYYRNKSSFISYFSTGSIWSRMYVAQFHVPHFDENFKVKPAQMASQEKQDDNSIVFSMNSAIAKADFYWR